jgi:hypothetical protein
MKPHRVAWALVPAVAISLACRSPFEGGGDLRARRVVLQREVDGIRAVVNRLERGEPMLPMGDVAIAIDDGLVRDIIGAQLPFEADVDRFHLTLNEAAVHFKGSPVVRLRGSLVVRERPALQAAVNVLGALEDIHVDEASATLRAKIAVDHLGIEKAAGIESVLSGATLDEVARVVRLQVKEKLPPIQIPVKVQQSIELPAVTRGPVRIDGASMPLQVAVSQVVAGQGRLWIAVHFQPGEMVKTKDAPEAGDTSAADAGLALGGAEEPAGAKPPAKGQGK